MLDGQFNEKASQRLLETSLGTAFQWLEFQDGNIGLRRRGKSGAVGDYRLGVKIRKGS